MLAAIDGILPDAVHAGGMEVCRCIGNCRNSYIGRKTDNEKKMFAYSASLLLLHPSWVPAVIHQRYVIIVLYKAGCIFYDTPCGRSGSVCIY